MSKHPISHSSSFADNTLAMLAAIGFVIYICSGSADGCICG